MTIVLQKAVAKDANQLHDLQVKSFLPLLDKYQDFETNPACEPITKTLQRIIDPSKGFFKILKNHILVGGIAVKQTTPDTLFLGPIFIDPNFQNQKIAQKALLLMEALFPAINNFELATIAQEVGNVYLYKKIGYLLTGEGKRINSNLEILFFRKVLG